SISTTSYDTALCIIPPKRLWPSVDRLRTLYDKAYGKWPPHVNLIYPFVRPEALPMAAEIIQSTLSQRQQDGNNNNEIRLSLDTVDVFTHKKHDNTIFLCDGDHKHRSQLTKLRKDILRALSPGQQIGNYQMHMTVAQSEDAASSAHKFLVDKVGLLPSIEWEVDQLYILVRERIQLPGSNSNATSRMKLWGTISFSGSSDGSSELSQTTTTTNMLLLPSAKKDQLQTNTPYYFEEETNLWVPFSPSDLNTTTTSDKTLTIASYNVLAEFTHPPSSARHSLLINTILSAGAHADVLVLQEVTDTFLSSLLADKRVRDTYPFTSHGPPAQPDVDPLPSLLNIVVLSRVAFGWEYVSFRRKHKGAVVVTFKDVGKHVEKGEDRSFLPVVLAAVHLSHGLTDGAVAAKKIEIQTLLGYLEATYPGHPRVVAGDFNITSSSRSVEAAVERKSISAVAKGHLESLDGVFADAGLVDAWAVTRVGGRGGYSYDDQGATYNPRVNELAAAAVGSGGNMRPQRYDRILVRGEDFLTIAKFNQFGFLKERLGVDSEDATTTYASDHWGVRCLLRLGMTTTPTVTKPSEEITNLIVPVNLKQATASLATPGAVNECLSSLNVLPTSEEIAMRKTALTLLKHTILSPSPGESTVPSATRAQPTIIVIPVGSYALSVWTAASDMDVLCIGPFSARTFFALATRRLRKAATQNIKILRRVKANSGTMLELQVMGIKMDLQYCPAGGVAQRWPEVLTTPVSDPIWMLATATLAKLKAARDVDYLVHSVPDLAVFRLASRFVKTWARARGIYAARFGFLGGIQIVLLVARVYKMLVRETGQEVSVEDLLVTFFDHYASFDWEHQLVFDPLFHTQRLPFRRATAREPLAILGYFPPTLNTSQAASMNSARTIKEEFERAAGAVDDAGSWTSFLCGDGGEPTAAAVYTAGAIDFLAAYKSYVKIDVQYWGLSPAKGAQFVGWLESRCVALLVNLHRRAPGVYARMWFARFVEVVDGKGEEEEERDYQGCYLIGLDKSDQNMEREELKVALGALQGALARFEEQIRGDEKYFDAKSCWMGASVEDSEEDSEDEDSEDYGVEGAQAVMCINKRKKVGNTKKKGKKLSQEQQHQEQSTPKLRMATDVLNRIRWDPEMDSGDYVVGYEDRFLGAQERALDEWKTEKTDEEFIPQHRILYFKRLSTGETVWDRGLRMDTVF
ncbi:2'-5' RNA ligase superfamily-domain-containing protein, partial [Bombardia bombarda]